MSLYLAVMDQVKSKQSVGLLALKAYRFDRVSDKTKHEV